MVHIECRRQAPAGTRMKESVISQARDTLHRRCPYDCACSWLKEKKGKKRKNGKPDVRFTQVRWNDGLNDSKDTIPAHSRSPDKNRHDRKKRKHDEIDAPGNRVATGNVIRKG